MLFYASTEVIMIVLWLVFTFLLVTGLLTFLPVQFFQCCSVLLIILQAFVPLATQPSQLCSLRVLLLSQMLVLLAQVWVWLFGFDTGGWWFCWGHLVLCISIVSLCCSGGKHSLGQGEASFSPKSEWERLHGALALLGTGGVRSHPCCCWSRTESQDGVGWKGP